MILWFFLKSEFKQERPLRSYQQSSTNYVKNLIYLFLAHKRIMRLFLNKLARKRGSDFDGTVKNSKQFWNVEFGDAEQK